MSFVYKAQPNFCQYYLYKCRKIPDTIDGIQSSSHIIPLKGASMNMYTKL